ncbi:MAG: lactonase family protein [Opitutaceae bacterium]
MFVYFGAHTQASSSRGIHAAWFDPADGSLGEPFLAAEAGNPTFLALAPNRRFLYSTGEFLASPSAREPEGGILSFRIDAGSGRLEPINREPTGGGLTTHLAVDGTGRMVALANYHAAYVAALPLLPDGRLGPRSALVDHRGLAPLGPNPARQTQAHAHAVIFSPDNRFVYACDLGLDRVFAYRADPIGAKLSPADPFQVAAPPGSGPRHPRFSPDGRFLYVANEIGSSVSIYRCEADQGRLSLGRTISTLPADFAVASVPNTVAEIRIHPNGRFVYVSNRGHDSIAVFARDPAQGGLSPVEIVPSGGRHPRNFDLAPDGRWLLCANRDTDNVVVFGVDPASGRLAPTGRRITVSQPVCVMFLP